MRAPGRNPYNRGVSSRGSRWTTIASCTAIGASRAESRCARRRAAASHWCRPRPKRAQPRFAFPVPARQLFLLPDRVSRAGSGRCAGRRRRRRPADAVLPREERGARDLGRLSLRPRRRARDLRLRRGAPDRRARRMLPDLAADRPALYTPLGLFESWDRKVTAILNEVRGRARTGVSAPEEIVDMRQELDALRLVKDEHEIALMRRAAVIPPGAHRRAMERTRAGLARVPGRGRARARVPALRRPGGRLPFDRCRWSECLRAALP